ncbi:MAG TPA: hypothetical protein VMR52_07290 [Dehalococcoidia bacterium]|nr:hypothetical protein [Dehalococcoidia bacterium]
MPIDPKLIDKLDARLTPDQADGLRRAVAIASNRQLTAYLVGGPVRDLLLDRDSGDLDVVVEGGAVAPAEALAADLGARIKRYSSFGTATVLGDDWQIDLITARSETYARPGALPTVHPATVADDLARRDFTINAMALALNGPSAGDLLDPHGGRADVDAGLIRVLHEGSFQDDATRIFRAARYASRFGFQIEEETLEWLERDLSFVDEIGGARVRREFERIFAEEKPQDALMRLHALGALQATHAGLRMTHAQSEAIRMIAPVPVSARATAFAILAWETPANEIESVVKRLALTKAQAEAVRAVPALRDLRSELVDELTPSQTDRILSPFPADAVLALGAVEDTAAGWWARQYLTAIRPARTILRGDDLVALGVPEGAALGEVLARLRAAKLDGEVATRADEEAWVRDYLARSPR